LYAPSKRKTIGKRNDRVAAQIRECISMALIRGDFPAGHHEILGAPCRVTVTYVLVTPDLRNATAFFVPASAEDMAETLAFLEAHSSYFRRVVAKKVRLKFVPELHFRPDETFKHSERIDELLKNDNNRE
jgi:ribosome-binding factor A